MRSVPAALFDLDGTLVDSLSMTFAAFNHAIISQGGRPHEPHEIVAHFGPGEREIFARIVGPDRAEAAHLEFHRFHHAEMHRVPLHRGVGEMLDELKSQAAPLAIVTGRSTHTAEIILRHHGLWDRFITVIGNDTCPAKPSPDGILLALERVRREPAHAIYVGDNWVDVRAAHDARVRAIAACWDLQMDRDEVRAQHPHGWAETPAEFLRFWQELRT